MRIAGGWMWRSILHDAFDGLSVGDEPELFQRRNIYRHGRPSDFRHCMRLAALQVYFQAVQKNIRIDSSRREIADALGVSFDTLKTWSDKIRKSREGKNEMECAKLAGRIGNEFRNKAPDQFDDIEKFGVFDGIPNLKTAEYLYWQLTDISLESLRRMLRRSRLKSTRSIVR